MEDRCEVWQQWHKSKVRVLVNFALRLLHKLKKTLTACQKVQKLNIIMKNFMIANWGEDVLIEGSCVSENGEKC